MVEEHVIIANDVVQLTLVMPLVLVPLSKCLELVSWSSSKFNTPLQAMRSGEFAEKAMSKVTKVDLFWGPLYQEMALFYPVLYPGWGVGGCPSPLGLGR
eukprot:3574266-Ditylum_brightwellii.AAC.1